MISWCRTPIDHLGHAPPPDRALLVLEACEGLSLRGQNHLSQAKDRDEPVVRNLPEAKPETTPLGVSNTDIALQAASTSSIPTVGEGLGHLVSGSGQWLIKAIDNYRLESGARLKATDDENLPKPVKLALRIRDKVAQNHDIYRGPLSAERPEAQHQTETVIDTASSKSGSEGEGDDALTPSDKSRADQGTPSNGTQSEATTQKDATAVRITYMYRGGSREPIASSVYLPNDAEEPPQNKEMRDVIDYCVSRKKQLIIGCDANAHHISWGSTSTNPRGESLMEFLVSSNLNILNHGNEPTFVVRNRKEAIDLTPGADKIENLVINWHVFGKPSLSDHRYICFQIGNISTK
ncbi:hypothetical protein B7P43_G15804 [Cryptotermes secundus]|uniref:Endonuclease/exonuclease/phosphatase domain-containing protein n=1 Tax=Cryptotermes secundus TaxID=105785 RepID=A0A2J7RLY7_9NEOP|nr:hypothetical protein B7P43_G15804 [Cryptotermes secundus]